MPTNSNSKKKQAAHTTKMETPALGWVDELREASVSAKEERTASRQLRVTNAYKALRQWKRCKTAAKLGLSLDPNDNEKQQLTRIISVAEKELKLAADSMVTSEEFAQQTVPSVMTGKFDIDQLNIYGGDPAFTNLNWLQVAAGRGDVRLLEAVVALGAALDFPVLNYQHGSASPKPAPKGSTALLLAAAMLALGKRMEGSGMPALPQLYQRLKGSLECAIRLVQLGADSSAKMLAPVTRKGSSGPDPFNPSSAYAAHGFIGKTVKELAIVSGKTELIEAIAKMESRENRIELSHCRCGSRLPWKECHAGPIPGQSPHYHTKLKDQVAFRYSPTGPCWCKLTKKQHYDCCWFSVKVHYIKDDTGELCGSRRIALSGEGPQGELKEYLKSRFQDSNRDPSPFLFPEAAATPTNVMRGKVADTLRTMGTPGMSMLAGMHGQQSHIGEWDPEVYAGVVDRLDNYFMWTDVHWQLDEPELLQRVKEWTEALEQYCNDKGLTGKVRQDIVEKHTASPFAPCGSPGCEMMEASVKEFQRCARCKTISYCSRDCQRAHWKGHKKKCIPS